MELVLSLFYFNSNMVRLKVILILFQYFGVVFQFQYGAIKRLAEFVINIEAQLFQFQYGAIKRESLEVRRRRRMISIPIWCD